MSKLFFSTTLMFCFLLTGCETLYQSNAIKQEAIKLDRQVLAFRDEKQSQVDTLNRTFQDSSEKLFDQLTTLCELQLELGRDLDAQSIADQAVSNPNKVLLPRALHDQSVSAIAEQFKAIEDVDNKIADARITYAKSSSTLHVAIDQLNQCHLALTKLVATNTQGNIKTILEDIQGTYNGVKSGISSTKK